MNIFSSNISAFCQSVDVCVQIRYCFSLSESAAMIRFICDEIHQKNQLDAIWIPENETKAEQFLSSIPTISLYMVHALINGCSSLHELFSYSLHELEQIYGNTVPADKIVCTS
jgi:ERCC4-type nuclease